MSRSIGPLVALFVLALSGVGAGSARSETLLRLDAYEPGELQIRGFELRKAGRIDVEAIGLRWRWEDQIAAYAWILDARTRAVVWEQEADDGKRVSGERLQRRVETSLDLPAGKYELYAWAPARGYSSSWRFFGFRGDDDHDWSRDARRRERALEDCHVTLSSKTLLPADVVSFEPDGRLSGALLRFAGLGDNESGRAGFRLDSDADLEIYAFTELPDEWENGADSAWIVHAATRERVWSMTHRNTKHAGGADKNRLFRDRVRLHKGEYVLYYGTDDSHSYPEFNANPPFDPLNWGITLLPAPGMDAGTFHPIDPPDRGTPLVEFTRLRDDEALEQAFRLARESEVWILALGEYSENGREFVDFGWIQKSGSSEIVWEMTRRNTEHAGGAEKNRMFDGTVKLPAGEYVVYYVTDDSHSYRRWNSEPPFERDAWGLAMYPAAGFRSTDFQKLDSEALAKSQNVMVRIVRIGDDESMRERFTLDKPERVRIYALGEGSDGRMYDYGFIENTESRSVVWEMTWRNTRHAGGAHKNRVFDGEILLEPGTYEVFYESDDSHSFRRWNAAKPRDPQNWGITISRAGN